MSKSDLSTELRQLKNGTKIDGKRTHRVTDVVRMLARILQRKKMSPEELNQKRLKLKKLSGTISYLNWILSML